MNFNEFLTENVGDKKDIVALKSYTNGKEEKVKSFDSIANCLKWIRKNPPDSGEDWIWVVMQT